MGTNSPVKKRRPFWLRLLIGSGLALGIVTLLLLSLALFFDAQITRRVLAELGKNLKTELKVGDASLSLFSGFPDASVDLSNVQIKDAFGGNLLLAREVSFRFDLASLFGDRIEIKTVRVSGGGIRVRINERGQANYEIFKTTAKKQPEPNADSDLRLALDNAELHNLLISFQNLKTRQTAEINLHNAGFGGDFSAKRFNLSSQADFSVARLQMGDSRYLLGESVHYDAVVAVDMDKNLYDFQRVELNVGGNTFTVEGIAVGKPDYTDLNLKLLSREGDISVLFDLLPEPYHSYFNDFQSNGSYSCTGFVKGRAGKTQTPTVGMEVALRDGRVSSEKLQSPLRNVSFKAVYSAAPGGQGALEIADFQGDFGGQPLNLSLKITNLDDPEVDFNCHGALPLAAAYGLFGNPAISDGDGLVHLNNLSVQGKYADIISMNRIANVRAGGELRFEEAQITYNKIPLNFKSGRLLLADNLLTLDSFYLLAGRSDLALQGSARNLLPVLFADSLNTSNALLEFSTRLNARNLDVSQLVDMFSVPETGDQPTLDSLRAAGNAERQRLTDRLKGTFEASIARFQYGKIEGDNFSGHLEFDHNQLAIRGSANAMQGAIELDGMAHFAISPTLKMRITARDIDLHTCMEQCENFDQEVVTADNLRGRLSGRVVLFAFWDERNEFLMDKLKAYADVTATNGELVGLKMLEDFSTFIHIEDLRRVKFNRLQNYLEISDQRLYLPAMLIQSNALNLTLSGAHTFDNDIDYKIKINAGQMLLNRIKRHDPDLDPLPAEKGWFNVFYTIVGNVDQYDMKRGKKAVKAEFERSEARKKRIANFIEQEFRGAGAPVPKEEDDTEYLDPIRGGEGG